MSETATQDAPAQLKGLEDGDPSPDVVESVVEKLTEKLSGSTLAKQIDEQVRATFGQMKAEGAFRPPMGKGSPYAAGSGLNGEFANFGQFLRAVKSSEGVLDASARSPHLRALNEGDGPSGGYLVPEEFRQQLLEVALQVANLRPLAFNLPMSSASMAIPAIRDTDHSDGTVYGGIFAQWLAEEAPIPESEPDFKQIVLVAKKLAFLTVASNELLADAALGSLEALLTRLFGRAIVWFEERAFIRGTGSGEPLGMLASPARVIVDKESGQNPGTILAPNIDNMWSRLLPESEGRAVWIANRDILPQLAALARDVGTGGTVAWMPSMVVGHPSTLYGAPILYSEHASTLGQEGDLILADMDYYLIGDREALTMASSIHAKFSTDQTMWRGTERLDARPWLDKPLQPAQSSLTLSPFVTLETR